MKRKLLIIFLIITCIITILKVGYIFLKDYLECDSNNKDIEELINEGFLDDSIKEESTIDWDYLISVNQDIVGWIKIDETPIDYPILKDNDNLFYLKHNYLRNYNRNGSIFTLDKEPFESRETLIYGHNMKNETMFSILGKYLDKEFLFSHQKIKIYTPNKNYEGVIFSAYSHGIINEKNNVADISFDEKIEYYKTSSRVKVNDINVSNKIIKLSTCSYINNKTIPTDQRYYIVATLNEVN